MRALYLHLQLREQRKKYKGCLFSVSVDIFKITLALAFNNANYIRPCFPKVFKNKLAKSHLEHCWKYE